MTNFETNFVKSSSAFIYDLCMVQPSKSVIMQDSTNLLLALYELLQKYNITTDELCSCVERKQEQQIIAGFMNQVPHYVTSDKDNLQAAISKILSAAKKCEKNAEVAKQISKDSSVYIAQKCHEHAYKESVEIIRQTFNL